MQLSPPSSLLPLPLLSSASVGVDRSGKSHPLSRTLPSLGNSQQLRSSASTATLVTTSPSTTAAYNRCSTSNYYESEANAFGEARGRRQWCANTACWWWGAEHLVADDLTTPLQKVEPKQHFANERTFLHWLHQAVYMTGLASAVLAFAPLDTTLVEIHALALLTVACATSVYAVFTFHRRSQKIRERQQVRWDDPFGPIVLGATLVTALAALFLVQIQELGLL